MGNHLSCNHDGDDHHEELFPGPNKLLWEVPGVLDAKTKWDNPIGGPYANRSFEKGEVVELSHCLLMQSGDMSGTFLYPFLFPVDPRVGNPPAGSRLWPYGWGLLYRQSAALANMTVEHRFEAPPAPPTEDKVESDSDDIKLEPCHWICFRATRAIPEGEELFFPPHPGQPQTGGIQMSIWDACINAWDKGSAIIKKDNSLDDEYETEDLPGPDVMELIEQGEDIRIVAQSPVHGVGIFAARDITEGEVIEIDPMLPLPQDRVGESILNNYAFQNSISTYGGTEIELMPIGMGASYNHSDNPNISHHTFADTPYLRLWVATEFIPKGRELCFDYGDTYFSSRNIELKLPTYEREGKHRLWRCL